MLKLTALILLLPLGTTAIAAPRNMLACGTAPGLKTEAEMKAIPSQGINSVNLTFIGSKPAPGVVDKLLRECAAVASQRDSSKDILVSAWFRKRAGDNPNDDDLLHPYGSLKFLSYEASSRTIGVRDLKLMKK